MLRNACVLRTNDYLQISPRLVLMDRLAKISTTDVKKLSRIRCLHVEILNLLLYPYFVPTFQQLLLRFSVADANMNAIPFSSNALSLQPLLRYVANNVHAKKHVKNEKEKHGQ